MKYIDRSKYLDSVSEFRKTHRIILLTGLHGAGKTVCLTAIARTLRSEHPPVRIVNTGEDSGIRNGRELVTQAKALGVGPSALCMDNADGIEDLTEALAEILAKYTVTIFVTGRNASILEKTLEAAFGTALATIRINPLSYGEFLVLHALADSRNALDLYCHSGGLPESSMIDPSSEDARAFSLIRANSFILTEIIEPHSIRNPVHIRQLLSLAARSAGETLSARQVCTAFSVERSTISPQAVLDYLEFCRDSGILIPVPVLDIDRKRPLDTGSVWYFGDTGLRSAFVSQESQTDSGKAQENLVFLRLCDDGWRVMHGRTGFGKVTKEEVSFVCEKEGKRVYIQMQRSGATAGERIRKRTALLAIRDAWPKYLVDTDLSMSGNDGIRIIFVRDLLLNGVPD